ncbi:MAG: M24 family metallopeptidase [Desulfobacterales bacterium]|nr:M24 family metallopeptidase [Desulfobacterales bacterium]
METMQPTLTRGRFLWDPTHMPKAEFLSRVSKIQKEMKKENIGVLLVYSRSFESGNICYIGNTVPRAAGGGAAVIIPQQGEVALIYRGEKREVAGTKLITWIDEVIPSSRFAEDCVNYLKEKNLLSSTIGAVACKRLMPYAQWQIILEGTKQCKMVDADHILTGMRMVKSERECDQIRRASRIINHIIGSIPDTTLKSMNEEFLEAVLDKEARMAGAEDIRILIAKPKGGEWALRPPEDAQISRGDSLIIYLAASFERYWSEGIRTFVAESASLTQPKLDDAQALYERIRQGIKPGKTASQCYKEAVDELQKSKVDFIPTYGLGQGIGLDLQEAPMLTGEDSTMLKEGMLLTFHLAIKDADLGAIMLGNTLYLGKDGAELLTEGS